MSGVAFIDTETTGLDPERNPIWEIAVILPDGPDEGEHCWQVQVPGLDIVEEGQEPPEDRPYVDRWVLDNTGFGERYDVSVALPEVQSIDTFCRLVEGRHLVGAVPSFDEERLRRLYVELYGQPKRFPWHYHLIDVEALAVGYLAAARRYPAVPLPWKSDDLGAWLGVEPTPENERHTALGDARWARRMYEAIVGGSEQ